MARDQIKECQEAIAAGRLKWCKANYRGSIVTFHHPDNPIKLVAGVVQSFQWKEYLEPGHIPDFWLTIKGRSGRLCKVSMVLAHVKPCEDWNEAKLKIKGEYYGKG